MITNGKKQLNYSQMKKLRSIWYLCIIILPVIIILNSCEGMRCAIGHVYDAESNKPLDRVFCIALTGTDKQYSDSTGHYSLCNNFGGCIPRCPDIEVEYSKTGYKTKKLTNPNKDNIYLEKEQ
jgi:hypothetical protein